MSACPCGSGQAYPACCGRWHGGVAAPTAEALMRARYCAYVLGLEPYLLATWYASTRPETLGLADDSGTKWLGLEIRHSAQLDEAHATVEFVARYRIAGRGHRLHEISRFRREDGCWYYVDGDVS
jgi:SEC-C motif-containing protein